MTSKQEMSAGNAAVPMQTTSNADESWKKANSTRDADSLAPLVANGQEDVEPGEHRKSWIKRAFHHDNSGHHDEKEKRKSIAESGPMIFVVDPNTGKEILKKNPHWPNEDTWKREKLVAGKWAFGSMMGQQNVDGGGTVG